MSAESAQHDEAQTLWAKGLPLDAGIHAFTVDEDPLLDAALLPWDVLGSAAHVRMLGRVGLLAPADLRRLLAALRELYGVARAGGLPIGPEQEDGHTALEQALVERAGEVGRRVHLGRSRNDQVILAMRLFLRDAVLNAGLQLAGLARGFVDFALRHGKQFMPGYTHLRRAMPSSLGQWSLAFAEGLLEELQALQGVYRRLDRCPLGAAAGFGVPLPLDRACTAELLGFAAVQRNPVDVNNSRGRHELAVLQWLASAAGVLEKYFWDLALFSTEEFGFFQLPDAFTTGSSIMPQKRNPDVVELARARCRELRGLSAELAHLAGGLPSSYHRDSQLLKAPVLRALARARALFGVAQRLVPAVVPNPARLEAACDDGLYAAHEASRRAAAGLSFREAYRQVAAEILAGTFRADRARPDAADPARHCGEDAAACGAELAALEAWLTATRGHLEQVLNAIWQDETS